MIRMPEGYAAEGRRMEEEHKLIFKLYNHVPAV